MFCMPTLPIVIPAIFCDSSSASALSTEYVGRKKLRNPTPVSGLNVETGVAGR